jgi:predicted O-linked N-acetylglucosamine transferase (SPINDLY family)
VLQLLEAAQRSHRAQRLREAQALYQQLLDIEPRQAHGWLGLGMVALQAGALDAAVSILARAVELAPEESGFRLQYAYVLQRLARFSAAEEQLQAACRLRPDVAQYWEDLGIVLQALGETERALDAYRRANALEPTPARRIKEVTVVSPIIPSRESIAAERQHIDAAMGALLAERAASEGNPMRMALWTNFYWAYHGLSDRALQSKAASVYRHLFPSLDYVAAHCRSPRVLSGRIRVGLISQFFHNHSIGRISRGLFAQLSREEFEVTAIFLAPAIDDDYARFIRQHAERSLDVPRDLSAARSLIEALQLDVLFYQDIGMDPFSYFLAFSRLAPVQCVSYGHPDTTGIPTIDYYVSSDMYETPGSEAHYSERLFLLRKVGNLAYYYRPERPEPRKSREHFQLPADRHLYVCPQNLFKVHPDMDELFAGILCGDPQATLVMIDGRVDRWSELLRRRWAANMPDVVDRIVFLPRMNTEDYANLIEVCDVMLDTRHFNGMISSLEAFAVGTPVVTWPGEFQRGRPTQAMYRSMGLKDCIAESAQDYIERAIRLGTDPAHRAAVRNEILQRNGALFEDMQVVREFERFFREAVAGKTGP